MALELPPEINSKQDVQTLAQEIRGYASWLEHSDIKKRLKIKKSGAPAPQLSPAASEVLRDWLMKSPLSSASLDKLSVALEALKDSASSLTIVLAAPVTGSLKKDLVGWCRKNISAGVLVSFEFNSTILGGMVLRYRSRIFDWSFRRRIMENHQKFAEVLSRV